MERSPQNHPQVRAGFLAEEVGYLLECFLGDWRVVAAVIQDMRPVFYDRYHFPCGSSPCWMPHARKSQVPINYVTAGSAEVTVGQQEVVRRSCFSWHMWPRSSWGPWNTPGPSKTRIHSTSPGSSLQDFRGWRRQRQALKNK